MIDLNTVHALKVRLFSRQSETVFTILDGASVPDLQANLASFNPEYKCLFRGELEPDMAEVAPYLAILERDAPFADWVLLNGWGVNWGIFGTAHADLRTLTRHFRRFLMVADGHGKQIYFRYYDPRVLRNYLPTCQPDELKTIFGPVITYFMEDYDSQDARRFMLFDSRLQHKTVSLLDLPELGEAEILTTISHRESPRNSERGKHPVAPVDAGQTEIIPHGGILVLRSEQFAAVGDGIYVERMRGYLNEFFPESKEVPPEEMGQTILELTERAAGYKLILETHVAPFIVAAWIFGANFDEEFKTVKDVLEDYDMDTGMKAQWLWDFIEETVGILEDGLQGD